MAAKLIEKVLRWEKTFEVKIQFRDDRIFQLKTFERFYH